MQVCSQRHAPVALLAIMTELSLYIWLDEPQGQSEQVRKISSPPALDPRDHPASSESLY